MQLAKYLLFYGADYYPGAGWEDFKGSYDRVEEAKRAAEAVVEIGSSCEWAQVVDTETGTVESYSWRWSGWKPGVDIS